MPAAKRSRLPQHTSLPPAPHCYQLPSVGSAEFIHRRHVRPSAPHNVCRNSAPSRVTPYRHPLYCSIKCTPTPTRVVQHSPPPLGPPPAAARLASPPAGDPPLLTVPELRPPTAAHRFTPTAPRGPRRKPRPTHQPHCFCRHRLALTCLQWLHPWVPRRHHRPRQICSRRLHHVSPSVSPLPPEALSYGSRRRTTHSMHAGCTGTGRGGEDDSTRWILKVGECGRTTQLCGPRTRQGAWVTGGEPLLSPPPHPPRLLLRRGGERSAAAASPGPAGGGASGPSSAVEAWPGRCEGRNGSSAQAAVRCPSE